MADNKAKRYRTMRETLGSEHPDTQDAFGARVSEVMATERANPQEGLWWLSFTDPSRPVGDQFLGVAIVYAPGNVHAIQMAHFLGINPGGQVSAWGPLHVDSITPSFLNRLLTKEEAQQAEN